MIINYLLFFIIWGFGDWGLGIGDWAQSPRLEIFNENFRAFCDKYYKKY